MKPKDPVFLSGKKVVLEPLSMRHFSNRYLQWMNDPVVCADNRHAVLPCTGTQMKNYLRHAPKSKADILFAIRLKKSGRHVGNISLNGISWINRSGEISVLIGEKSVWGRGIGTDACRLVMDYGFERLGLHRIWMGMTSRNIGMVKIARRLSMKREGVFKDFLFKDGRYLDMEQWRKINAGREG